MNIDCLINTPAIILKKKCLFHFKIAIQNLRKYKFIVSWNDFKKQASKQKKVRREPTEQNRDILTRPAID